MYIMGSRLDLHETFCNIINLTEPTDGDRHVYFKPPESLKIKYPAIIYDIEGYQKVYATDGSYRLLTSYNVILIDRKPNSAYVTKILALPYCRFDRSYASDNLYHFVFKIFY